MVVGKKIVLQNSLQLAVLIHLLKIQVLQGKITCISSNHYRLLCDCKIDLMLST